MSEEKQRSALFKFLYVILVIVTFPIFAVLFILRHPLQTIFVLLILLGAMLYYPHTQGVRFDDTLTWYQNEYSLAKKKMVILAQEKGMTKFVPSSVQEEVKQIEMEEYEAGLTKNENYNQSLGRSEKIEDEKVQLKQRRGFKKKENAEVSSATETAKEDNKDLSDNENSGSANEENSALQIDAENPNTQENIEIKDQEDNPKVEGDSLDTEVMPEAQESDKEVKEGQENSTEEADKEVKESQENSNEEAGKEVKESQENSNEEADKEVKESQENSNEEAGKDEIELF